MNPPDCLTVPYTIARPRPVPWPRGFVVKNGSKACAWVSSSIPIPLSLTVSCTYGPGFTRLCSSL